MSLLADRKSLPEQDKPEKPPTFIQNPQHRHFTALGFTTGCASVFLFFRAEHVNIQGKMEMTVTLKV